MRNRRLVFDVPRYWVCFLSNDLRSLGDVMMQLSSQSSFMHKRELFVPCLALVSWLEVYLARTFGVVWGLQFHKIGSIFARLFHHYFGFIAESSFWKILEALRVFEHGSYVSRSALSEYTLSSDLSDLFDGFSELDPFFREQVLDAQQLCFWKKVFEGKKTRYELLQKMREQDPKAKNAIYLFGPSLELFAIDRLTPFQMEVFRWLSQSIAITFYVFSPSSIFWGDDLSKGAKRKIARNLDLHFKKNESSNVENFLLEDVHPLLGSWGGFGKSFLHALEDCGCEIHKIYKHGARPFCDEAYAHENILWGDRAPSRLDRLKETLLICPSNFSVNQEIFEDKSIKILCAPDKWEQVIRAKAEVREALKMGFSPSDVLIVAPDLAKFEPIIAHVFSQKEMLQVGYKIWKGPSLYPQFFRSISSWMDFLFSDWDRGDFLRFFSGNDWKVRLSFDQDFWNLFLGWIEQQPYFWGYTVIHRKIVADEEDTRDFGALTWQEVRKSFLYSLLVFPRSRQELPFAFSNKIPPPVYMRDYIQSYQHVCKILGWLNHMCRNFSSFLFREGQRPKDWLRLFLDGLADFPILPGEEDDYNCWITCLQEIKASWENVNVFVDPKIFWARLSHQSSSSFEGWAGDDGVDVITFAPMQLMRCVPFPIIVFLGLDEYAFPISDRKDGVYHKALGEHFTSRIMEEKYAFLEYISVVQARLVLLYSAANEGQQQQDIRASSVVEELLLYLSRWSTSSSDREITIPQVGFEELHQLCPLSEADSDESCCASRRGWLGVTPLRNCVDIRELRAFLSSPPLFYLKRILGYGFVHNHDPLAIKSFNYMQKIGLDRCCSQVVKNWIGAHWDDPFSSFELRIFEKNVAHRERWFGHLSSAFSSSFLISDKEVAFPPVKLDKYEIVGTFSDDIILQPEGLYIALDHPTRKELAEYLPEILLYSLLSSDHPEVKICISGNTYPLIDSELAYRFFLLLIPLCFQGMGSLLPFPFSLSLKNKHISSWKSSCSHSHYAWLIEHLEHNLSEGAREHLFIEAWKHLVDPFEGVLREILDVF